MTMVTKAFFAYVGTRSDFKNNPCSDTKDAMIEAKHAYDLERMAA